MTVSINLLYYIIIQYEIMWRTVMLSISVQFLGTIQQMEVILTTAKCFSSAQIMVLPGY